MEIYIYRVMRKMIWSVGKWEISDVVITVRYVCLSLALEKDNLFQQIPALHRTLELTLNIL